MEIIGLDTIRRTNLAKLFDSLSRGEYISRAAIAKETGISLVTVAKLIDLLEKNGVIVSQKEESVGVGRKSFVCALDRRNTMLVFDLSVEPYSLHVVDILLNKLENYAFDFDNLGEIMLCVLSQLPDGGKILGMGCVLPDSDDAKKRYDQLISSGGLTPDIRLRRTGAIAVADSIRYADKPGIQLTYDARTNHYFGVNITGNSPSHRLNNLNFHELLDLTQSFTKAIAAIDLILHPDWIQIEWAGNEKSAEYAELLEGMDSGRIGDIQKKLVIEKYNPIDHKAVIGVALSLRDQWLEKLV